MFLFGIRQGNAKTNWIWIVIVGVVYFIVYYLLFSFLINKFDLKTREEMIVMKLNYIEEVMSKQRKKVKQKQIM